MAKVIHDVIFNLDQFFKVDTLKKEPVNAQEKIKVQEGVIFIMPNEGESLEEELSTMALEEVKEENEIIWDLEVKQVKSKHTMEVMLPIVSHLHFRTLYWLDLWIEENITNMIYFSFSNEQSYRWAIVWYILFK